MLNFKLQIGCLVISLYIIVKYVIGTSGKNAKCNKYFDLLMIISPWAIIFDGITAWTVNHRDICPAWVNLLLHGLFFVTMVLSLIYAFLYMVDSTIGMPEKKWKRLCLPLPGYISIVCILIFLKNLRYEEGKITDYSMGLSVYIGYSTLLFYFILMLGLLIFKRRTIEKRKRAGVIFCVSASFIVLILQSIFPEALISALFPTFLLVGLYMSMEDPALKKLQNYNTETVLSFATLVESRDNSTGGHIKRTRLYVEVIINEMKNLPEYERFFTKDYIQNVIEAAPMHDIGKISTPDYILQKPGKLTNEEFEIMKQHSVNGGDIIIKTFAGLNEPEYLKIAYEVALYHHEKWNGKGYPMGLAEQSIPLHARIMAVADVFDAVSAKRCYRDALPLETCFKIIEEGIGTDFDPKIARLFLDAKDKVITVYENEKD